MKDFWKSGIIVALGIGLLYFIFVRECKHDSGKILVDKVVWDSIQALANKPPVIKKDTIRIPGDTIYILQSLPTPQINPNDTTIKTYKDSINNDDIKVWCTYKIKGTLLERSWMYTPMYTEITIENTVYVPKIINQTVPINKNGLYLYGIVGGNSESFLPGLGVDFITKKNTSFGYQYQRFGSKNIHSIKVGFKIL
jgi:hypothetical protein